MTTNQELRKEVGRCNEEIDRLVSENMSLHNANKYNQEELEKFKEYNYALKAKIEDLQQMLKLEQEKRLIAKQKYRNLKLKIANLLIK